jgi:hypothetical protein
MILKKKDEMKVLKYLEKKHKIILTYIDGHLYVDEIGRIAVTLKGDSCKIDYLENFDRIYIFKNIVEVKKWLDGEFLFPIVDSLLNKNMEVVFKYLFIYWKKCLIAVV